MNGENVTRGKNAIQKMRNSKARLKGHRSMRRKANAEKSKRSIHTRSVNLF